MKDIHIRASSLPSMFDCAARWEAQNILGLRTPSGGPAHLGTSIHHAAAKFDQARIEDSPIEVEDAVDLFVDRVKNPTEEDGEINWDSSMPRSKAVDVGAALTVDYCERISPRYVFDAVELKCNEFSIDVNGEVTIHLTGTTDRVRTEEMDEVGNWWDEETQPVVRHGIADLKSGKRIIDSAGNVAISKHVAQLGTYELIELLANRTLGYAFTLPAEVIALPTSGKHRKVSVETVESPSRILLGDDTHPEGLLHAAAKMAKAELFPGNPYSMMCGEKYCPIYATCWWRGVK